MTKLEEVRRLLREFLDARDRGEEPAFEEYLIRLEDRESAGLFREMLLEDELVNLIVVEFDRRREAGEDPDPEEYLRAFPSIAERLRVELAPVPGLEAPGGPAEPLKPGRFLGQFRLVRFLGRGAFGEVWAAEQEPVRRPVALKVLDAAQYPPQVLARFERECRILAELDHPNIVPVYDAGRRGRHHYCAMKLLEGRTLAQLIEILKGIPPSEVTESRLWSSLAVVPGAAARGDSALDARPPEQPPDFHPRRSYVRAACRMLRGVAEALAVVHDRGVIHRDLKPQNIMILTGAAAGTPVVLDFGLAAREAPTTESEPQAVLGTIPYMSPEQVRGARGELTCRSDVFSFGCVAYEFLTLRRPFDGSPGEVAWKIEREEPPPIRRWNPRVPADLESILRKAMEKRPEERYPGGRDLAADLTRFLNSEPVRAAPPGPWKRAVRFARRRKAVAAAILSGTAALLGGAATAGTSYVRHEREIAAREALVQAGRDLARAGNLGNAEGVLLEAIEKDPGTASAVQAAMVLAGMYFRAGYIGRAEGVFRQFVTESGVEPQPGDLPGAMALGGFLGPGEMDEGSRGLLHDACRRSDPAGYEASKALRERLGPPRVVRAPPGIHHSLATLRLPGGRRVLVYATNHEQVASGLVVLDPCAGRTEGPLRLGGIVHAAAAVDLDPEREGDELAVVCGEQGAYRLQTYRIDEVDGAFRCTPRGEPLLFVPGDAGLPSRLLPARLGGRECLIVASEQWAEAFSWDGAGWKVLREGLLGPFCGSQINFLLCGDVDGEEGEELVVSVGEWKQYGIFTVRVRSDLTLEWVGRQLVGVARFGALSRPDPKGPWDLLLCKSLPYTGYGSSTQVLGRFRPGGIADSIRYLRFDRERGEFGDLAREDLGELLGRYRKAAHVKAGDLDGDGASELLWIAGSTVEPGERDLEEAVSISGRVPGETRFRSLLAARVESPQFLYASDLDGDGDDELAVIVTPRAPWPGAPNGELHFLGLRK